MSCYRKIGWRSCGFSPHAVRSQRLIYTPEALINVSGKNIGNGIDMIMSAVLLQQNHYLTCYVMCDEICMSVLLFKTWF